MSAEPSHTPPHNFKHQLVGSNGHFNLSWLFKTSVTFLKQHFLPIFQSCLILVVSLILASLLIFKFFSVEDLNALSPTQQACIDVVMVLIIAPLTAGLAMMGIECVRGSNLTPSDVFRYFPSVLVLAIAQLFISILVQIGLSLLIIPGVYLLLATTFTLPLIVDKRMRIFDAIVLSCRTVNKYILSFSVLFVVFFVLFLLSVLTFGLVFLITMPLYFVVFGVIYVALFDEGTDSLQTQTGQKELTFNA